MSVDFIAEDIQLLPDAVAARVEAWSADPGEHQTICMTLKCDGQPVEAKAFADMLTQTVKLLGALEKQETGTKRTLNRWAITEAAVIEDRATFTVMAYPKSEWDKMRKEQSNAK